MVERARQILASINDLEFLKKTYNLRYAEIKNLNTPKFWNKLLFDTTNLQAQDGMTKDRVKTSFKFLSRNAKKILDIGAGNGFVEELIGKNKGIKIYGNDISSIAVRKLKERFKGDFKKESLYSMKYPKKSFDSIFMLEVLEHIAPSKVFSVLKKVREILRKKGSLIVSIPTNEGLEKKRDNLSGHLRTYTENLIRAELKIAGFKVVKLKTLYAFKNFYNFKKISAKILRKRWQPNDIVILAKPE
ncbi:MAG: class I SAM-dependent methyltransferase [Candidatus Levybacteria bacterium]|nr:class I SAM-dependent methyltransferase [Candidatus Levybacteria bacterium]